MFKQNRGAGLLFVLPALLFMIIFVGCPIVYNIILSFQDTTLQNLAAPTKTFVGFENYLKIIRNVDFPVALYNTFYYTFCCLLIQFTIGFLLALFFNLKFTFAKYLKGIIIISWILPTVAVSLLFRYLFSEGGVINQALLSSHLISQPVLWFFNPKFAMWILILANCWVGIPFNTLLLLTGLSNIPASIIESAKIDGADPIQRFFFITLPMMKPAIQSVLVLGFIYTFKVFDLVFAMTSGGPGNSTEVLSTLAYRLSFKHYYFSEGAATANILVLFLFGISLLYVKSAMNEKAG